MEMDYNFWRELLDTYQSSNDWLKALWVVTPPAFVLLLIRQFLHHRRAVRKLGQGGIDGKLAYTAVRDDAGRLHLYRHSDELPEMPEPVLISGKQVAMNLPQRDSEE
jgi:hypothetical protein